MSEVTKISDLCYTASFMFDKLADISMQVHDLEKETSKSRTTVEDIEKNVIKFNKELDDVPRMRPSAHSYVPRRSTFTRPLDTYRVSNSPYTHYQMPSSYRLVSNSTISGKTFNLRNDQMAASSNTSLLYRKRPAAEVSESPVESKQVKGIKWVAASGEDVQNSGLNIANLAKSSNSIGNYAPRREYQLNQHAQPINYSAYNYHGITNNYQKIVKTEPLSPMKSSKPLSSINQSALNKPTRKLTEEEMAVNSLLHSFSNENVDSDGTDF